MNHDPLLNCVLGENRPVAIVDARDDRRLIVLEGFDQREVDHVRQHEAGWNAERQGDEEGEKARVQAFWCGWGHIFGHHVRIQ